MAGLMGALVSGAVGGYAKQRVADIDEQEKFDFANALADADFNRRALLQEMGYKQNLELEDRRDQRQISSDERRLQNQMDVSDHNLENNMTLKDYELNAAQEANQQERDRMKNYAEGAESLTEVQNNIIRGGELDAKTIASMKGAGADKPDRVKMGDRYYEVDANGNKRLLIDDSKEDAKSGEWKNEDTRQVQSDINNQIDAMVDNGIMNAEKVSSVKSIAGKLLRQNKDRYSVGEYLKASQMLEGKDTGSMWLESDQGVEANAVMIDGQPFFLSNRTRRPSSSRSQTKPKQVQQSEPRIKPQNNAAGLMQSANNQPKIEGWKQHYQDSSIGYLQNELRRLKPQQGKYAQPERVDYLERLIAAKQAARSHSFNLTPP